MADEDDDDNDALGNADIVSQDFVDQALNGHKRKRDSDTTEESDFDVETENGGESPPHEGDFADASAPRLPGDDLESSSSSDESSADEDDEGPGALLSASCPVCDLATSEIVQAMDACSDRLAGQVSESRLCAIQLEIWEKRMAPLRQQGRSVPLLTLQVLRRHYTKHRINVMRSVSEDIRVLECMQRTLRRTGLCDYDQDNNRILSHRASNEMCRISKQKMDLLKFYSSLQTARRKEMQNN